VDTAQRQAILAARMKPATGGSGRRNAWHVRRDNMPGNNLPKFSTISVDKTVQKPDAISLTMLFQKKFPSSPIREAEFFALKTTGCTYILCLQGFS
jgi:hypothetical protein